jgi:Na+:H+ antiporter, NhaA family
MITESTSSRLLIIAIVVALAWANSPWSESYASLWSTDLTINLGSQSLDLDLRHWINEGLVAIFFFVVGLEIKRELVTGELRDRRKAALPVIAAVGGMLVPALIYLAVNAGGPHLKGWGIPLATDVPLALGVLGVVRHKVPPALALFLLALAVVDDLGTIVVIAVGYSSDIDGAWLGAATGLIMVVAAMRLARVTSLACYVIVSAVAWYATLRSGINPTVVAVAVALITPTSPLRDEVDEAVLIDVSSPQTARETEQAARHAVGVAERLEYRLHPWTSYVIVPLFALANGGIEISGSGLGDAAGSPITWGVLVGRVIGKPLGIVSFAWLACRLRVADLPSGTGWRHILGAGALGGMGFTVAIFVADSAFTGEALAMSKLAVVLAAVFSAGVALIILGRSGAEVREPAGR